MIMYRHMTQCVTWLAICPCLISNLRKHKKFSYVRHIQCIFLAFCTEANQIYSNKNTKQDWSHYKLLRVRHGFYYRWILKNITLNYMSIGLKLLDLLFHGAITYLARTAKHFDLIIYGIRYLFLYGVERNTAWLITAQRLSVLTANIMRNWLMEESWLAIWIWACCGYL